MDRLPTYKPLGRERTRELIAAAQSGDVAARNQLITSNLRLVTKIATREARKAGATAMIEDLVQVGIAGQTGRSGIVRAIETFDSARGVVFSTHAYYWIRDAVSKEINARHPTMSRSVRRRAQPIHDAVEEHGTDDPSVLSEELGVPRRSVADVLTGPRTHTDVECDTLRHADDEDPTERISDEQRAGRLLGLADRILSERERAVVRMSCGFDGTRGPLDDKRIAELLGISRKAVPSLRKAALAKLREYGSALAP